MVSCRKEGPLGTISVGKSVVHDRFAEKKEPQRIGKKKSCSGERSCRKRLCPLVLYEKENFLGEEQKKMRGEQVDLEACLLPGEPFSS